MSTATLRRTERIRELNDVLRTRFLGGTVTLTAGMHALPFAVRAKVLEHVRTFKDFDEGNDPHNEHDFASLKVDDQEYFFKVDYYDRAMKYGSPDPADPAVTTRVLTIMRADEY